MISAKATATASTPGVQFELELAELMVAKRAYMR